MKRLLLVFVTILFSSCSLDNKTGIWKDVSDIPIENQETKSINDNKPGSRYEDIFTKNETFNEEKKSLKPLNVKINNPVRIANWFEKYAIPTNNSPNFFYKGNKKLLFKSSKLSKHLTNDNYLNKNIIFYKNNLISHNHKG